jgi:hypothetical protein
MGTTSVLAFLLPDRRNQLIRDPLQLFHFDNQGAACFGFGDHRPLLEKTGSNPDFECLVGPCKINGETIAPELELGRNAIGSLVQNLLAGFVPPEPPNRTSRHSAIATWVSGRFGAGKPPGNSSQRVAPCRRGFAS